MGGQKGVCGEGTATSVLLWLCMPDDVSVSSVQAEGVHPPYIHHPAHPRDSSSQDMGTVSCQHGDSLVGRCMVLYTHG